MNIIRIPSPLNPIVGMDGFGPIVDHPRFQRLRDKMQTGQLYRVYPGARMSRFEHSVGVYQIAQHVSEQIGLDKETSRATAAYALLHDIAHIPFSHNIEPLLTEYHDDKGIAFIEEMRERIEQADTDPKLVIAMAQGKCPARDVVKHKVIGADRLDYLFRDAHHIGRKDQPDVGNIIQFLAFQGGTLSSDVKNAKEVKRVQQLYYDAHTFFYYLRQYVINNRMMQRAVQACMDTGDIKEQQLYDMIDSDLEVALRNSTSPLASHFERAAREHEHTYKAISTYRIDGYVQQERIAGKERTAHSLSEEQVQEFLKKHPNAKDLTRIEDAIAQELDLDEGDLIIATNLDFARLKEPHNTVLHSGDARTSLFEYYPDLQTELQREAAAAFALHLAVPAQKRTALYAKESVIAGCLKEIAFD
jgi:HD superfamily phosphohydrolase